MGSSILFPLITFLYISRMILTDNVGKVNFGLSVVSCFLLLSSHEIYTYAIHECSAMRYDKCLLAKLKIKLWSLNMKIPGFVKRMIF